MLEYVDVGLSHFIYTIFKNDMLCRVLLLLMLMLMQSYFFLSLFNDSKNKSKQPRTNLKCDATEWTGEGREREKKPTSTTKTTNQIYRCIYINRLEHAMHKESRTHHIQQQQQQYQTAIPYYERGNSTLQNVYKHVL